MSGNRIGGGLSINRIEDQDLGDYPAVERFSEGIEKLRTKTYWHDLPGHQSILVKRETWLTNQYGTMIRHEVESWDQDTVHKPAREYLKLTYARLWLPGRTTRSSISLVDRIRTVFWSDSIYASSTSNEQSYRSTRSGVVLYRTSSTDKEVDTEKLKDQGRELVGSMGDEEEESMGEEPGGPDPLPEDEETGIQIDTIQTWDQALERQTIVEKEDAPVTSMWKSIEIEDHRVEETWSHIIKWTVKKDLLRPGKVNVQGPTYTRKIGAREEILVPLDPPTIESANVNEGSVAVSVVGGGAVFESFFPKHLKIPIRPQKYRLYRRIVSRGDRTQPENLYGIYEPDSAAPPMSVGTGVVEVGVTFVGGGSASSLPDADPDTEPIDEDFSPEDVVQWTLVGEVKNDNADKWGEGHGAFTDTKLEANAVYEYVATCIVGDSESPYSEPRQVTYTGSDTGLTGVDVDIIDGDGYIELDITAADDIDLYDGLGDYGSDFGDYGETVVYDDYPLGLEDDPLDLEDDDYVEDDWKDELIEVAEIIGKANIIRDDGVRQVQINPVIPILGVARGQYIKAPAIGWTTTGNSIVIDSETVPLDLRIDGFSYSFSATENGFSATGGTITATMVEL